MTDSETFAKIYGSPYLWFSTYGKIEDKNGKLITPVASKVQRDILMAYQWLTSKGMPVRLAALPKARQSYVSSITAALFYHHWRRTKSNLLLMADENSRVIELWGLLQRFHTHDGFESRWDSEIVFNTEFARMTYRDEEKRTRQSFFRHETSSDPDAGAATARQGIWFSEACLYPREGDAADFKVIGNALASVGNAPETLCVMESRAKGPSGHGHATWQGAVTLKDRLAGKVGNSWIKIFCPWHDVAEYRLDRKRPDSTQWFDDEDTRFAPYREREKAGVMRFNWTPEQVAWRRWKLIGEMKGNEAEFDSQFPESEEAAFRASGNPRLHPVGVANLLKLAEVWHNSADRGTLERDPQGRVRFVPSADGWLWIREHPKNLVGAEVCLIGDLMTGDQSVGSGMRDCHAVGVLRNTFHKNGVIHPVELIATIDVPGGCRWDLDYLADRTALLSEYFDWVSAVTEVNGPGLAFIVELRNRGVPIYQRPQNDAMMPGKMLKVPGFRTDTKTRPMVIETLARYVRESSGDINEMLFRCCYKPAVEEMAALVTNERGKVEASPGAHDDWPLSIAIGLFADYWSVITADRPYGQREERSSMSAVCS